MPNGRQIGPHRRPGGGVAMALAHGAAHAYRNRKVIKRVAHVAKAFVKKTFTKRSTKKVIAHKHDQRDTGVGAEFTKMSVKFGKPVKNHLPKLLLASIKAQTCRASWVNQYDNPASATTLPGNIALNNFQLNGTGYIQLPLHLIDITSWLNTNAGNTVVALPLWTLNTDVNGVCAFTQSQTQWNLEQAADRPVDTAMMTRESDLLKSVSARFLFYGATGKPTRFSIDLISLNDDSLQPDININMITNSENVNLLAGKSAFWTSMVRPMLWSPLVMGDAKATSGHKYKVHQHTEFILQEKLSNEPNSFAGHMKQVNYALHLDRIQRYDWNNKVSTSAAVTEGGPQISYETNDLCTVVSPKRRLYLMIRAQSAFNNGATNDPSKTPSYDLVLRSKHESVV